MRASIPSTGMLSRGSSPPRRDPGGDHMTTANIVGVDPHRETFTATVLDQRGGELGHAHFPNTREGHGSGVGVGGRVRVDRPLGHRGRQRARPAPGRVPRRGRVRRARRATAQDVGPPARPSRGQDRSARLPPGRRRDADEPSPRTGVQARGIRHRRTRSVSGSPCGTTPARRSPRSASSSSANSMRSCTICLKTSAASSGR